MPFGGFLIHVGIEGVAGEVREMFDVVERDRTFLRDEGAADIEILEVIAEGMTVSFEDGAPFDHRPVMPASIAGEPCSAERCM